MYVNSNNCCANQLNVPFPGPNHDIHDACPDGCQFGSDVEVANLLRSSLEELFHETRVNIYFAGHLHWIQRQAAVYQGRTVQHSETILNSDLDLGDNSSVVPDYDGPVAFHDNPQATVHILIGTAGQGFQIRPMDPRPEWNEALYEKFGYAILNVVNSTCLVWETINNVDGSIIDKVVITQPLNQPLHWDHKSPLDSIKHDESSNTGPNSIGFSQSFAIIFIIVAGVFTVSSFMKKHYSKYHIRDSTILMTLSTESTSSGEETPFNISHSFIEAQTHRHAHP